MKKFFGSKALSSVFLGGMAVSLTVGATNDVKKISDYSKDTANNSYLNFFCSALTQPFFKYNTSFRNTIILILVSSFLVWKIKYAVTGFLNKEKFAKEENMKRVEKELEDKEKLLKAAISYIDKSGAKKLKSEDENTKDTENKKLIEKVKQLEISQEKFKNSCKRLMSDLKDLADKVNSLAKKDPDCSFFNENRFNIENLNIFIYKLCCNIKGIRGSYNVRSDISGILAYNYGDDIKLSNKLLLNFELINPLNEYNDLLTEGDIDNVSAKMTWHAFRDLNNTKNMEQSFAKKVDSFLKNDIQSANYNSYLIQNNN